MPDSFSSLEFTTQLLKDLTQGRWQTAEVASILKCLELLDTNDRHPSLRMHALKGELADAWTVYATRSIRIVFDRLPEGRKRLLTCTRHYDA